jgi:hypothetical protein
VERVRQISLLIPDLDMLLNLIIRGSEMDKKFMRSSHETVPNFTLFRDALKLMMQQGLECRTRAQRKGHFTVYLLHFCQYLRMQH